VGLDKKLIRERRIKWTFFNETYWKVSVKVKCKSSTMNKFCC